MHDHAEHPDSRGGIATDEGAKSFEQVGADLAAAVTELASNPRVATSVLGAVGSPETVARLQQASGRGRLVLASRALPHPEFATAQIHTPVIVALDQADSAIYGQECFGPVSYLVATESAEASLQVAEATLREHGALTLGVYSTDAGYLEQAVALGRRTRVALSINLTQGVFVNQSAAFSDYHATGGNPAANASYTSLAFVADRFVVVQRREHMAAPSATAATAPAAA